MTEAADPKARPHDALIKAIEQRDKRLVFHDYYEGKVRFRIACPECGGRAYATFPADLPAEAPGDVEGKVIAAMSSHSILHPAAMPEIPEEP